MKLKLVVLDLELSRRQKTLGAAGLGAAILLVGAVAVADVPNTFVAGDTLTAAGLNANFAALDDRLNTVETAPPEVVTSEWVPYTTDVTSTAGTPLTSTPIVSGSTGHWRRVGDTLEVRIGTQVNCTSGFPSWGLPSGLTIDTDKIPASYAVVGSAHVENSAGTAHAPLSVAIEPGGRVVLLGSAPGSAVGTMDCNGLGASGKAKLAFAVPIEGWTVSGP